MSGTILLSIWLTAFIKYQVKLSEQGKIIHLKDEKDSKAQFCIYRETQKELEMHERILEKFSPINSNLIEKSIFDKFLYQFGKKKKKFRSGNILMLK